MTSAGAKLAAAFEVEDVRRRLEQGNGGYDILDGRGTLTVEGKAIALTQGQAVFVPAGAAHQFTGYEGLSVLVVFARQLGKSTPRSTP